MFIFHYIITYLIFSVSFSFCNWVIPEKNIKKTEGDMGGSGGGVLVDEVSRGAEELACGASRASG